MLTPSVKVGWQEDLGASGSTQSRASWVTVDRHCAYDTLAARRASSAPVGLEGADGPLDVRDAFLKQKERPRKESRHLLSDGRATERIAEAFLTVAAGYRDRTVLTQSGAQE